jgi:isopentenyldiphosphate isomerase
MEYLDILDKEGNKTGDAKSYEEAHQKGLIHRSVHVWILNPQKELLIQKREKTRRAYPSHWDISAAGHISAGQTSVEAAQRETKEELGLDIPVSEFKYLFTVEEHIILNNGTYVNNEFQDVYLIQRDISISDIKLTDGEVDAVKFVTIDEFKKLIKGEGEPIVPHKEEYQKLLGYISTN